MIFTYKPIKKVGKYLLFLMFLSLLEPHTGLAQQSSPVKGMDMTHYVFRDTAQNEVSFKQFEGRYILVDLWASWCYPCRQEFPAFDALSNDWKDKNIAFVQLSIDADERRWGFGLSDLAVRKPTALQWYVNNNLDFLTDLQVFSVPRYLLIDPKGKLYDPDLRRPTDPELIRILQKLKGI